MNELKRLEEIILSEIEIEKENLKECTDKNSCLAGMIMGTIDTYGNVLLLIKDLK